MRCPKVRVPALATARVDSARLTPKALRRSDADRGGAEPSRSPAPDRNGRASPREWWMAPYADCPTSPDEKSANPRRSPSTDTCCASEAVRCDDRPRAQVTCETPASAADDCG